LIDYTIQPILMGGLIKSVEDGLVKTHLHGRLGVITVPARLVVGGTPMPGSEVQFYFSYVQVVDSPWDYDCAAVDPALPLSPCLVGGKLVEVNDTAAKAELMDGLGTVAVPRRWVFTNAPLAVGQWAEVYFSCLQIAPGRG